jgi:hypothetical protein
MKNKISRRGFPAASGLIADSMLINPEKHCMLLR